jgi:hypothetical protein
MNWQALCEALHQAIAALPRGYQLELRISRDGVAVGVLDRVERYFVADSQACDIPSQIQSLVRDSVARERRENA